MPTLWQAVEALTDHAPDWHSLELHRLDLIAARRRRDLGLPIPADVVRSETLARARAIAAEHLLQLVREAYDGRIVLIKGPEAAARYPDPLLRSFVDLDLLVDDAEGAQNALLAAGFREAPDPPWAWRLGKADDLFENKHHSRPLEFPGIPLKLELHRRPSWPLWLPTPDGEVFLAAAEPGATSIAGILALPSEHHALVLAAHGWVDNSLARARDLIDVAVVVAGADASAIEALASELGVERLWRSTARLVDAVLGSRAGRAPELLTFARNLPSLRERTVLESHLATWLSPFSTLRFLPAMRLCAANLVWDFRPAVDESWSEKLRRAARALRNAVRAKSQHDASLGPEASQFHPSERWHRRTP